MNKHTRVLEAIMAYHAQPGDGRVEPPHTGHAVWRIGSLTQHTACNRHHRGRVIHHGLAGNG